MKKLPLNAIITCHTDDGHPVSEIIGIDNYTMQTQSGETLKWHSYTLVPSKEDDRKDVYARWYVVDFPSMGRSFVRLCKKSDLADGLKLDEKLSGDVRIISEGDAELGTGTGSLNVYHPTNPKSVSRYSREVFADGSTLYFEMCPLKQEISIMSARLEKTSPHPS